MAYNRKIHDRVRQIVNPWPHIVAKKMFGGISYLYRGNMVCGVHRDFLILRLGPDCAQAAIDKKHGAPFDITGRPMKGWVMVDEKGFISRAQLDAWLSKALHFVKILPPK